MASSSWGGSPLRSCARAIFSLIFLFALLSPSPVCAQAEGARLEAIRQQMDKGQGFFLAKKYEEAAAAFEAGYDNHPYSAFLFNAGVCYQKLGKADAALAAFGRYLEKDPHAPDAASVRERIGKIKEALKAAEEAAALAAAEATDDAPAPEPVPVVLPDAPDDGMKSLVVIETEPAGAPVHVYRRTEDYAPDYTPGAKNTLWKLVSEMPAPLNLTLDVGRYHVVIDDYQTYNGASTNLDVSSGHVHHFKANLSQGEFTGFLDVTTNVVGAKLYLDDDGAKKTVWGVAPHGALISPGEHTLLVEAPGYESVSKTVELSTGAKEHLEIELQRVGFGVLRLDADVGEVTLSVDQKPIGTWRQGQAAFEVELEAGPHEVLVSSKGYKDLRHSITIPKGQILPMRARMVEKYPRGAAWTHAVFSAGFLGAGIFLGVESNRLNKELGADRDAGYLHEGDPRLKRGFWYSVGADSAFALSGIFGLLATYNFIRDPYPDPKLQIGKQREFKEIRTRQGTSTGGLSGLPLRFDLASAPTWGGVQ